MRQLVFAYNNFGLNPCGLRIAKDFNDAAFGITLV